MTAFSCASWLTGAKGLKCDRELAAISGERQRTVGSLTGTGYHRGWSARAVALSENFCMFGMCQLEYGSMLMR